jgi:hypothetical protein
MSTRRPALPVAIVGPVPPLEDTVARLVAACARLGLLEDVLVGGGEGAVPDRANSLHANAPQEASPAWQESRHSGKEVPSMRS